MDVDHFDRNSVAWAKYEHHFPPLPSAFDPSEAHITFDDSDGDDSSGACFLCPFCYVDIEVSALCVHLEEEHCFDMKNAVCPVCAANFGRDLIAHLTIQHAHLLKRRKFHKFGSSSNDLETLGKDLEKLLMFLGIASTKNRINVLDSAPDPLVSPSIAVIKGAQEATPDANVGPSSSVSTAESEISISERSRRLNEEMIQRAHFYQELIVSTIF